VLSTTDWYPLSGGDGTEVGSQPLRDCRAAYRPHKLVVGLRHPSLSARLWGLERSDHTAIAQSQVQGCLPYYHHAMPRFYRILWALPYYNTGLYYLIS
jgi:hypothetical protein